MLFFSDHKQRENAYIVMVKHFELISHMSLLIPLGTISYVCVECY